MVSINLFPELITSPDINLLRTLTGSGSGSEELRANFFSALYPDAE